MKEWSREKDVTVLLQTLKRLIERADAVIDAFLVTDANDAAFVMALHEYREAITAGHEVIRKVENRPTEFLF